MIVLQLFARYREAVGIEREELPWSVDWVDLRALREHLLQRGAGWAVLAESQLMCARNQEMCSLDEPLTDGDEVAFFPPVTGG